MDNEDQQAYDAADYSAPHEDESQADFAFPGPSDEDAAATQDALQRERDKIDAAVSELNATPLESTEPTDPYAKVFGEHADDYQDIGLALSWWRLDQEDPLSVLFSIGEDIEGYLNHMDDLIRHGLPEHVVEGVVSFDIRTGPIMLAALQFLGLQVSSLRPDVEQIIRRLVAAIPDATEDEQEALLGAHEALRNEQRDAVVAKLGEALGFSEAELDLGEPHEDGPTFDAGLN